MSGNFTVLTEDQEKRIRKLEAFYAEVRDIANSHKLNDHNFVYRALSKVNPKWNQSLYADDFDNA